MTIYTYENEINSQEAEPQPGGWVETEAKELNKGPDDQFILITVYENGNGPTINTAFVTGGYQIKDDGELFPQKDKIFIKRTHPGFRINQDENSGLRHDKYLPRSLAINSNFLLNLDQIRDGDDLYEKIMQISLSSDEKIKEDLKSLAWQLWFKTVPLYLE